MAIEFVSYDDSSLQPGKFYNIRINKDMATAVIEAPPSPIHFTNSTFITADWNGISSIEIWKVDEERLINITNKVDWYIVNNVIIVNSYTPITGYIKFI